MTIFKTTKILHKKRGIDTKTKTTEKKVKINVNMRENCQKNSCSNIISHYLNLTNMQH